MTKGELSMRIATLFTNYYSIYVELLIIISHSRGMLVIPSISGHMPNL